MRSQLLFITPKDMTANPSLFDREELDTGWYGVSNEDKCITLEKIFMDVLCDVKLYGYMTPKCTRMVENLFRNIMNQEQNKEVDEMVWHFECSGTHPYSIFIRRSDMKNTYAANYRLGYDDNSSYYYDKSEEDEWPVLNIPKYLKSYADGHMESPKQWVQLLDPMAQMFGSLALKI